VRRKRGVRRVRKPARLSRTGSQRSSGLARHAKVAEHSPTDHLDKREFIGRTRLLFNLITLILQTDSTQVISVIIQDH
jgi:hypothetical protein